MNKFPRIWRVVQEFTAICRFFTEIPQRFRKEMEKFFFLKYNFHLKFEISYHRIKSTITNFVIFS